MVTQVLERRSRQVRKLCQSCRARKARFQYRGHVRADRNHTLCFECFRAERNRQQARLLAGIRPHMLRVQPEDCAAVARQRIRVQGPTFRSAR